MNLNADFSKRISVRTSELPWQASPMPGVERRMLDRIGDEVARATTIVRYAPNSHFSAHTHTGGEEFIVLDGVFQDEHGDFPVGSYVRNPPTSSHTPGSDLGCTIFVKLWQFDMADRTSININMEAAALSPDEARDDVSVATLFKDARETVLLEHWEAGAEVEMDLPGGAEILILEGSISEGGENLGKHDWLRLPPGSRLSAVSGDQAARVWIKIGHLPFAQAPQL